MTTFGVWQPNRGITFVFVYRSKKSNNDLISRLTKGRIKARQRKMQLIARLLDAVPVPSSSPTVSSMHVLRQDSTTRKKTLKYFGAYWKSLICVFYIRPRYIESSCLQQSEHSWSFRAACTCISVESIQTTQFPSGTRICCYRPAGSDGL